MMKKILKLNIQTDDTMEDEIKSDSYYNEENLELADFNRGQENKDRLKSNHSSDLDLIKYFLNSSNKDYDFSYHWFEKCNNLNVISKAIQINIDDKDFIEEDRDYACEFELLKLITEDSYHKDNLIELPKSLKKLNRYNDILPCK
jgi:hypothetical protein